jgi:threonine synthase
VQAIAGRRPALPPRLAALATAPERFTVLPNDLAAIQSYVVRQAGEGKGAAA